MRTNKVTKRRKKPGAKKQRKAAAALPMAGDVAKVVKRQRKSAAALPMAGVVAEVAKVQRKAAVALPMAGVVAEVKAGVVAEVKKVKRHALHNRAVLAAAIITLVVFGGSAALPKLFDPADPMAQRIDDAAFKREVARALGEGRPAETGEPLIIVTTTRAAVTRGLAEFRDQIPVQLTPEIKIDLKPENKAAAHAPRQRIRREGAERRDRHAAAPKHHKAIEALASVPGGNALIAEARKYLGGNPTGWASNWCGKFLDMVLKRTGHKGGGNVARGYIKYGPRLPGPEIGAIAIFSRKGGGHVGIVTGVDSNGNPIIISGNHNDRVAIATYPASRALAYVRP